MLNAHLYYTNGAVAQLGERLNGIQEVTSSILVSSTKKYQEVADSIMDCNLFFLPIFRDEPLVLTGEKGTSESYLKRSN